MIPKNDDDLRGDYTPEELPTHTFKLNILEDTIVGFTDEQKAMTQAIYLILNIERYAYIIYSWNYGVELADLFGLPIPFVMPEVKRRIIEALTQDTRILKVDSFSFSHKRGKLFVDFTAHTIYGDVPFQQVVRV